ncbi:hypothetical protein AHAS_Ahas12G0097500 [Arachis hypogaea]
MENHHEGEVNNQARRGGANPAGQERRVLGSYINPNPGNCGSSIQKPTIHANNFELKPQLITLVHNNFKSNGVHLDTYRLLLFPFSLRDKASKWLESFPKESLTTWENVMSIFLTSNVHGYRRQGIS